MEHPPPRATLPPLRERVHTPASQHRLLRDELIGVAFFRHLLNPELTTLLRTLEAEFDSLIDKAKASDTELQDDGVYCVKFPPLSGVAHFLISRCSERYHLRTATFGQDEKRFLAVYLHPRDVMRPVLRLDDFALAASYYTPPPPPPAQYRPRKQQRRDADAYEGYSLDAEELPLTHDYAPWAQGPSDAADDQSEEPVGYECEIAACHEHVVEIRPLSAPSAAPVASSERVCARLDALLADGGDAGGGGDGGGLVAVRPLPAGCAAVFRSAQEARAFIDAHRAAPAAADEDGASLVHVELRLPPTTAAGAEAEGAAAADGDELVACEARALAALQQRRRVLGPGGATGAPAGRAGGRGAAPGGAPRALQAALRGLGRQAGR